MKHWPQTASATANSDNIDKVQLKKGALLPKDQIISKCSRKAARIYRKETEDFVLLLSDHKIGAQNL